MTKDRQRRHRWSGSVYQRASDGYWCAMLSYPTARGEKRRRKSLYGKTREEVQAKLDAFLAAEGESFEKPTQAERLFEARQLKRHIPTDWAELLASSRGVCTYCRTHVGIDALTRDHKVPLSRGGSDSIENLTPSCLPCNVSKSNLTAVEYIAFLVLGPNYGF